MYNTVLHITRDTESLKYIEIRPPFWKSIDANFYMGLKVFYDDPWVYKYKVWSSKSAYLVYMNKII